MPGLVPGIHVFFPATTGTCDPPGFKFAKKNINKKRSRLKYKQGRRIGRSAAAKRLLKASGKGILQRHLGAPAGRGVSRRLVSRRLVSRSLAEREMIVTTTKSDAARARAEASFKKEERAKEGAKAMMEYQANGRIVRERMAQLRALRLAKEAKEAADKKAVGS